MKDISNTLTHLSQSGLFVIHTEKHKIHRDHMTRNHITVKINLKSSTNIVLSLFKV